MRRHWPPAAVVAVAEVCGPLSPRPQSTAPWRSSAQESRGWKLAGIAVSVSKGGTAEE
jgi:hypothetical protein